MSTDPNERPEIWGEWFGVESSRRRQKNFNKWSGWLDAVKGLIEAQS